jgi:hypothetical protein
MRINKRGAALLTAVLLLTGMATPAHAAPPTPLDKCIDTADAGNYQEWVCLDGKLHVQKDAHGKPANLTLDTAPQGASLFVLPMKGGDDWDVWCEKGSVCNNNVNAYYSKTKGNAAYGNTDGVVGTFDIIIETRLSGRAPRWTLVLNWDSGPTIYFTDPYIQCLHPRFLQSPSACGQYGTTTDPYISSYTYRWSKTFYRAPFTTGVSGDYYGEYRAKFHVAGGPTLWLSPLRANSFYCPASGTCKFS